MIRSTCASESSTYNYNHNDTSSYICRDETDFETINSSSSHSLSSSSGEDDEAISGHTSYHHCYNRSERTCTSFYRNKFKMSWLVASLLAVIFSWRHCSYNFVSISLVCEHHGCLLTETFPGGEVKHLHLFRHQLKGTELVMMDKQGKVLDYLSSRIKATIGESDDEETNYSYTLNYDEEDRDSEMKPDQRNGDGTATYLMRLYGQSSNESYKEEHLKLKEYISGRRTSFNVHHSKNGTQTGIRTMILGFAGFSIILMLELGQSIAQAPNFYPHKEI